MTVLVGADWVWDVATTEEVLRVAKRVAVGGLRCVMCTYIMCLRILLRSYYDMVVYAFPLALYYHLFIDYFPMAAFSTEKTKGQHYTSPALV